MMLKAVGSNTASKCLCPSMEKSISIEDVAFAVSRLSLAGGGSPQVPGVVTCSACRNNSLLAAVYFFL
jgi:hypothetical protein